MVVLYKWSPSRPIINLPGLRRYLPRVKYVNFGDELGPIVVRGLCRSLGLDPGAEGRNDPRLLSVGSILHFARDGDAVWGSGINGKEKHPITVAPGGIDFFAVRGPRTHAQLTSLGFTVPAVFGDPALLLAQYDEHFAEVPRTSARKLALIPNLNDAESLRGHPAFISPLQDPLEVAKIIASSEFVIGSSLHALVLADVYGIPSRRMVSSRETDFKYADYYEGTDRELPEAAVTVDDALRLGGSAPLSVDLGALVDAFPRQLFKRISSS